MFTIIAAIGYGLALATFIWGVRRAQAHGDPRPLVAAGLLATAIAITVWGGFWLMDLYGEMLWFETLGYGDRFTLVWGNQLTLAAVGAVILALVTWSIARMAMAPWPIALPAIVLAAMIGGSTGMSLWSEVLLFRNATMTGITDPALGRDVGFYLFQLPLYRALAWPLILALWIGAAAAAITWSIRQGSDRVPPELRQLILQYEKRHSNWVAATAAPLRALLVAFGLTLLLLGYRQFLARYGLVVEGTGFPAGAGYVDVNFRIPVQTLLAAAFALLGVVVLALAAVRRDRWSLQRAGQTALVGGAALAVLWVVAMALLPAGVQRFRVSPNELAAERPYIQRSIDFTRQAFGLHQVIERTITEIEPFTSEVAEANADLLREIPLWDYRALLRVFAQFQEIRLYYEFRDVDIDRYNIDGQVRQVMIAARELDQTALPEQSRTFLNMRFKYTHGHGVVAVPVAEFTPDGQPRYFVSNIPARSTVAALEVTRPEIYFGELTNEHVYVNSLEPEFDYPSGEQNVETFYQGTGGVPMSSFMRKLIYAKRFDGTRLLFARHVTPETRVMFRRQIRERVQALAPFLLLDADPYIVVSEGRLFWIMDAYTAASDYPYSERISSGRGRINYIRNSVKVVVDAYNGTTDFYIQEPDDPIIRTWDRAIPGLFKPAAAMPEGLRPHIRYPEGLLMVQGTVFAKYHMRDLAVFYNNEDLWEPAMEKYYAAEQQVEPYYTLWRAPGSTELEFVQMWPFTPRMRNVMAGWLAGASDGENYGQLYAYRLPKDRQILGPLQFEAKIDQDEQLAQLMTLWGQGGSQVIRGHVLSLPIGDAIVHIEPIYLESRSSSFPELQLIAVMHGDHMGYGRTLDDALRMLFTRTDASAAQESSAQQPAMQPLRGQIATPRAEGAAAPQLDAGLARQASDAFEAYLRLQAEGRFEEAGRELARVRDLLRRLADNGWQ
jgi:uncharacterized protein